MIADLDSRIAGLARSAIVCADSPL